MRTTVLAVVFLVVPTSLTGQGTEPASAGGAAEAPLLFEAHDPLTMTIRANIDQLEEDRDQEEEEREGSVRVTTADGTTLDLDLQIRTRGRFRLERSTCRFPPLRLNLRKGQLEGTFLEGQDKLKLVTHCRDDDRYEQNLLEEYLVYRMFNQITDRSFRVRLARITYEDTGGRYDPMTRWGFLIEDEELMAERLGGTLLETEAIHPAQMTGPNTGLVTLFQYMVGNTDFSLFQDHNAKLVDLGREIVPVPYDFDWTGFVNAPYAQPNPRLPIESVRERVYRGLCRRDVDFGALYALFNARRGAIEELIRAQEGLGEDEKGDALAYIGQFYDTINDEDAARRRIESACRR